MKHYASIFHFLLGVASVLLVAAVKPDIVTPKTICGPVEWITSTGIWQNIDQTTVPLPHRGALQEIEAVYEIAQKATITSNAQTTLLWRNTHTGLTNASIAVLQSEPATTIYRTRRIKTTVEDSAVP